jgi:hypothetical protein
MLVAKGFAGSDPLFDRNLGSHEMLEVFIFHNAGFLG